MVTIKSQKAHYYIFETVQTVCTTHANKHDTTESIISQLQLLSEQYLLHCFFLVNNRCYWKKFLDKTGHHTHWLNYSQNTAFNKKKQVQSAYFSGRQHTLHNTVIQSPDSKILHVYHLSDDTNHDSVMTFHILTL